MGEPRFDSFVSYSSKDRGRVEPIVELLGHTLDKGFVDWRAVRLGDKYLSVLEQAVRGCERFYLCWSANAARSKWVERELGWALERWEELGSDSEFLHVIALDEEPFPPAVDDCVHAIRVTRLFGEAAEISTSRLPRVGEGLFGRDDELAFLDEAWDEPGTRVVSLVAWGGVGKTALVTRWILRREAAGHPGAARVFCWSFYSQGTREDREVSGEPFVDAALEFFGHAGDVPKDPWARGLLLAKLVRAHPTLLVLDGLEPLQDPPGPTKGRLRDMALRALLRELAARMDGLCLITTRVPVTDLDGAVGVTVERRDLANLAPEAGRQLLEKRGVEGTKAELEEASKEFGGHALALSLLGSYLTEACGRDVRKRDAILALAEAEDGGHHARRVMRSYELWLGAESLQVLRLVGLFDRPAQPESVDAVRAAPAIKGLTDTLVDLPERQWKRVLHRLSGLGLVVERDRALDAHPLVREHFGARLRTEAPEAWREAQKRLFRHFAAAAPDLPDTRAEMEPLYQALAHGCAAGMHGQVWENVYLRRIRRGDEFYSLRKLGAFASDLAGLSHFYVEPWRVPVLGLTDHRQAVALAIAGFGLRALGRLPEAAEPMEASLVMAVAREDWKNAAIAAGNLSELLLTVGRVDDAVTHAHESVGYADRSGDASGRGKQRAKLADALHQRGELTPAQALFEEAEALRVEPQSEHALLHSPQGYRYCDLLLSLGRGDDVRLRAERMFEGRASSDSLLTIALSHLALGRSDPVRAAEHLEKAVAGLRAAGQLHELPCGLLARAAYHRSRLADGDPEAEELARRDMAETLEFAERCGMKLFECDAHLELARLELALDNVAAAREHVDIAERLIEETNYGRRRPELEELRGRAT